MAVNFWRHFKVIYVNLTVFYIAVFFLLQLQAGLFMEPFLTADSTKPPETVKYVHTFDDTEDVNSFFFSFLKVNIKFVRYLTILTFPQCFETKIQHSYIDSDNIGIQIGVLLVICEYIHILPLSHPFSLIFQMAQEASKRWICGYN